MNPVTNLRAPDDALLRTFSRADSAVLSAIHDVAALGVRALAAPIAVVGFVEHGWLRYPVALGLEDPPDVPLEQSFCRHTLEHGDVFVIPDARADLRFARSPLVTGPHGIRFYAGAPLAHPAGGALGVVAVLDRVPRAFTPEDMDVLRRLASQVVAQLELARAREMLEAIFRQSSEGIVVVDEKGAPQLVNQEARRQRGAEGAPDPAASPHEERIPVEDTLLYRAAHGERIKNETWTITAEGGDTRWLSGTALPLRHPNGSPAGAILLTRDETARVRMQEQLEREGVFREQLIATVGHDLRTPLSGVLMGARFLEARGLGPTERTAVGRIVRLAERMDRMVHDLLDYSRIRQGQRLSVVRSACDLAAVAAETTAAVQALHPDRTIRLVVQGDTRGAWDADRLTQVLGNLLANALVHGDRTSAVTVRIEPHEGEVVLSVHNMGEPIPPESMGRLFQPFWKGVGGTARRTSGGLGLGLHIVQEIVRAHGGTLGVRSSRSEGTTFSVALPRGELLAPARR